MAGIFGKDSSDYFVLAEAARLVKDIPGLTLEIGFREGGSSEIILDVIEAVHNFNRTHIAIDPFGSLPYVSDGGVVCNWVYDNDMKTSALAGMYQYVSHLKKVNFIFLPLEDTEFFTRFSDGVPSYYNGEKFFESKYALVFCDGPHDTQSLLDETDFFKTRMSPGGIIVYDDLGWFNVPELEKILEESNFSVVTKTAVKASYRYNGTE